jgi:hypothetical protein
MRSEFVPARKSKLQRDCQIWARSCRVSSLETLFIGMASTVEPTIEQADRWSGGVNWC